jgi:hypothetical protein
VGMTDGSVPWHPIIAGHFLKIYFLQKVTVDYADNGISLCQPELLPQKFV